MLTYRYVDDGWYCVGYWIEDGEERYAEAPTEEAAKEICDAVNFARTRTALAAEVEKANNGW